MKLMTKVAAGVGATASMVGMTALPASATTKTYTYTYSGNTCDWSVQYDLPTTSAAGTVLVLAQSDCLHAYADVYYTYKGQANHDYIWMPEYPNTYYESDPPAGSVITKITTNGAVASPHGEQLSGTHTVYTN